MISYKPYLATLVPKTWETRLEIIKAIGTLAAQSHEDHVRLRRAEVAWLRGEFEAIARELRKLCPDWPLLIRSELRKAGFNPNEPRVPAGRPDGGQWTSEGGLAANDSEVVFRCARHYLDTRRTIRCRRPPLGSEKSFSKGAAAARDGEGL